MTNAPPAPATLAVVDLGSNSFRLEIGRVEGDQIYRLDTWRETLRIGAAIDTGGRLTPEARKATLACLARFAERLRGLHPSAVRVVATNTFRVATNAAKFLPRAERVLGYPIDVITGHEEARLIYMGVAHVLPPSDEPRLVIDIGGGSTEFVIGRGLAPERLESLKIGCVGVSQRFFPGARFRPRDSPPRTPPRAPRSRPSRGSSPATGGRSRTRHRVRRWRWPKSSSRTAGPPRASRAKVSRACGCG